MFGLYASTGQLFQQGCCLMLPQTDGGLQHT